MKAEPASLCGTGGSRHQRQRRRASAWSSRLAPEHTSPVYFNDLLGYPMCRTVIRDSLPTRFNRVVVINDAETPGRHSRVERVERLYRGFVEVAIKPQYSDAINRGVIKRVFEPPRKKADLVIQQAVAPEIRPNFRFRHRQHRRSEVQPIPFVCFVVLSVRGWYA